MGHPGQAWEAEAKSNPSTIVIIFLRIPSWRPSMSSFINVCFRAPQVCSSDRRRKPTQTDIPGWDRRQPHRAARSPSWRDCFSGQFRVQQARNDGHIKLWVGPKPSPSRSISLEQLPAVSHGALSFTTQKGTRDEGEEVGDYLLSQMHSKHRQSIGHSRNRQKVGNQIVWLSRIQRASWGARGCGQIQANVEIVQQTAYRINCIIVWINQDVEKICFFHTAFSICREGEIPCIGRHFVLAYETPWKLQFVLSDEINVAIVTICFVWFEFICFYNPVRMNERIWALMSMLYSKTPEFPKAFLTRPILIRGLTSLEMILWEELDNDQ